MNIIGNKLKIENELEKKPKLIYELGEYKNKFIKWCAKQRFLRKDQLEYEVYYFKKEVLNKRLYNTDNKLWKNISKKVFDRDNYTCQYCGQKGKKLEVDHIIPISKSGTNHISNLATACRKCNRQKKDKTPIEFLKWRVENA